MENTEIRITQTIGKQRGNAEKKEEISRQKAHTNTWKLNWNISTITDIFLDQKRVNVYKHTVKKKTSVTGDLFTPGKRCLFVYAVN